MLVFVDFCFVPITVSMVNILTITHLTAEWLDQASQARHFRPLR